MLVQHVLLHLLALQCIFAKNITLSTNDENTWMDGARVFNLDQHRITINNNKWDVSIADDGNQWGLWIDTDNSWGFHPTLPSKFTLKLYGNTVSSHDCDMVISFTDGMDSDIYSKYFTMIVRLDGNGNNLLSPGCDTNLFNPSILLNTGDVYLVMADKQPPGSLTRQCRAAYIDNQNICPYDVMGPASTINSWPITFVVENYPYWNRTIIIFEGNGYTAKSCSFAENMLTDIGHNIYLTTIDTVDNYQISKVFIEYELLSIPTSTPSTKTPTTANPTTANPTTTNPTTSNPTTAIPTTAIPTSSPITNNPTTVSPSKYPTTSNPTTSEPSITPTSSPSNIPSQSPTSSEPTISPSSPPTTTINPTVSPTQYPTISISTSINPTLSPTEYPTINPIKAEPTTARSTPNPTLLIPTNNLIPSMIVSSNMNPTISPSQRIVALPTESTPTAPNSEQEHRETPSPTHEITTVPIRRDDNKSTMSLVLVIVVSVGTTIIVMLLLFTLCAIVCKKRKRRHRESTKSHGSVPSFSTTQAITITDIDSMNTSNTSKIIGFRSHGEISYAPPIDTELVDLNNNDINIPPLPPSDRDRALRTKYTNLPPPAQPNMISLNSYSENDDENDDDLKTAMVVGLEGDNKRKTIPEKDEIDKLYGSMSINKNILSPTTTTITEDGTDIESLYEMMNTKPLKEQQQFDNNDMDIIAEEDEEEDNRSCDMDKKQTLRTISISEMVIGSNNKIIYHSHTMSMPLNEDNELKEEYYNNDNNDDFDVLTPRLDQKINFQIENEKIKEEWM